MRDVVYPKISSVDAKALLLSYKDGNLSDAIVTEKRSDYEKTDPKDIDKYYTAVYRLVELYQEMSKEGNIRTASRLTQPYHALAAESLHKNLQLDVGPASDPSFWNWLNFGNDQLALILVDKRYGDSEGNPGSARDAYYGLNRLNEGFLSALWLRAEVTFDPENSDDPYQLTKEVQPIDFWVSDVIQREFGGNRTFIQAYLKFVAKEKLPEGVVNDPLKPTGYRDLTKELHRRNASMAFELMNASEAYDFIQGVWDQRKTWCEL